MHVAIAGGSGFVGKKLTKALIEQGNTVAVLTRNPEKVNQQENLHAVRWLHAEDEPEKQLEGVDAFVNLAGESLMGRWTEKKQKNIIESRLQSTQAIIDIIRKLSHKPNVLVNASAVGYYGMSESKVFTENDKSHAKDFLATVVQKWEEKASLATQYDVRTVFTRFGVILGSKGVLPLMTLPYRLHVGGVLGSGQQWVSWVDIDDVVNMIIFAIRHNEIEGAFNVTSPQPLRMKDVARYYANILNRKNWLPVPAPLLKLTLGKMSEMVTCGQHVYPKKALENQYTYVYGDLEASIRKNIKEMNQD